MKKKIFLRFPKALVAEPITYLLVKEFGLKFNIFSARVTPEDAGHMGIEVEGDVGKIEAAMKKIKAMGIGVSDLEKKIRIDRKKCQDCGACISVCPTKALKLGPGYALALIKERCMACGQCVDACPFAAILKEE
jgi:NAD-dependent dihydropyrimidine dehydrogenase PreA subunit